MHRPEDPRPTVCHLIGSLEGGGTERTLCRLLQAMSRQRIRHTVLTFRQPGAAAAALPDSIPCCSLGIEARCLAAGLRLARVLRREKVSVLHARNTSCWVDAVVAAALCPGVQLVLGYHGRDSAAPFRARVRLAARVALRLAARFSVVSTSGKAEICSTLGIPDDRTDIIENGVDLRHFHPATVGQRAEARASVALNIDDFIIGAVASLTPIKRLDVLLQAAAKAARTIPRLRVVLVGDGPERSRLAHLAARIGLADRIAFLGSRGDVPQLLKAFDAFVSPSDYECLSNAILEAMATGLPIIATAVGENPRLIRPGVEGALVATGDSEAIAEALITLAADPVARASVCEAVRRRALQYDFARTVARYDDYYEALTRSPKSSSAVWPQPSEREPRGAPVNASFCA